MTNSLLQVTPKYLPAIGGVETVVRETSERLAQRGYSVTVYSADLTDDLPAQEWINGVQVKRYRSLYGDPLYWPHPSFFRDIRRETESVVHIHNIHTLMPLAALLLGHCRGVVLQPHYHRFGQNRLRDALFTLHKSFLSHFVLRSVGLVLANSPHEARSLRHDFPRLRNISLLEEAMEVGELQSVPWAPESPARVLYVGKLLKYKKVDRLLAAFSHLEDREALRLVIVGDGPELDSLHRQAAQLGIQESIEWKSGLTRAELLSEYSRASVLACLSTLESFGRTTMEALCIGMPVVVPNGGALADVTGRGMVELADPDDTAGVARGITRCLTAPQGNAHKRDWVSWDEYVSRLEHVYDGLASNRLCEVCA